MSEFSPRAKELAKQLRSKAERNITRAEANQASKKSSYGMGSALRSMTDDRASRSATTQAK